MLEFAWQHCATLPHGLDLGLEILSASDSRAEIGLTTRPEHETSAGSGVTQGAVLYSLADTCSGLAVFAAADDFVRVATLGMHVEYLAAVPTGTPLVAKAHCHTIAPDLAFARCDVVDGAGSLVATATATFVRRARQPAAELRT